MIDRKYLDKIGPIPDALFKKIRKAGTKTGSKVFGGWEAPADIDYIMPLDFSPNWSEGIHSGTYCLCTDYDLVHSENGMASANAITENGSILHLLFPHDEDLYQTWVKATEVMKFLISQNTVIEDRLRYKPNRIQLFEALKQVLL